MFLYPNKFFQGMFFIFRKQIFYFQIFLGIPEDRWSKSNTSLEKSPFSKPGLHTVTSVPEIGKTFFSNSITYNYVCKNFVNFDVCFYQTFRSKNCIDIVLGLGWQD